MQTIDALGKACPIPVIEAKKAIGKIKKPEELVILVDNKPACENLGKMAKGYGFSHRAEQQGAGRYCVTIAVTPAAEEQQREAAPVIVPSPENAGQGLVVAIGRNAMGHGDDELGKILVKGFVYSLAQLPTPPKAVAFFNSGVQLTVVDSNVKEDLMELENRGTRILVCGTCANFYNLKEQVAVGEIVNMYAIVEQLAGASSIMNL